MAWTNTKGFNFRLTNPYVTDGTNEIRVDLSEAYPSGKTIDGDSFDCGFESSSSTGQANRNAALDARLAGIVYKFGGTPDDFRIDLPSAGNYIIRLAVGDATDAQTQNLDLLDGSSVLLSISNVATGIEQFIDASGTLRTSAANWVSNQAETQYTFSTTILRVRLKTPTAGSTTLAHLAIRQATGGGGGPVPIARRIFVMP
jgi:hypothetical protein